MYHQKKRRNVVTRGLLIALLTLMLASAASANYYVIGDFVWHDVDGDGIQDEGEEGVDGVIVNAYIHDLEGNPVVKSTVTATRPPDAWACTPGVGTYILYFGNKMPDKPFYLEFVLPNDMSSTYTFTRQNQGGDDALDSDVDSTGRTSLMTWPDEDTWLICDFDAGIVEKAVPCGECKGKVIQLTLQYNGTSGATVQVVQKRSKKDGGDIAVFDQNVEAGELFTVLGTDKNGTLGTEISLYVNGVLNTKIHTSCSKPIGPGLISGDFEVIEGYSKDGGLLCPAIDCGCKGKVTQLTFGYLGTSGQPIMVTQGKGKKQLVVFSEDGVDDVVSVEGIFTINGRDKDGTLGTEISIYVGSGLNAKIHTSCSKPIGPGLIKGDFIVLDGYSLKGGQLCPVRPSEDCKCDGKVTQLTLQYNGDTTEPVVILQKKDDEPVFMDHVEPGGQFTFSGRDDKGTLGTEISIYVGEQMELNAKIHTSCSQPIGPGLIYGDFEIVEGYSLKGGRLCPFGDDDDDEDDDQGKGKGKGKGKDRDDD